MSDVREQLRVLVKEALESYGATKLNSPWRFPSTQCR